MKGQMELVKEMLEARIVDQEFVIRPLQPIKLQSNVQDGKQVVPPMGRVVLILNLVVQDIMALQLLVWDMLDQMEIVKEQIQLQILLVASKHVLMILLQPLIKLAKQFNQIV
jgi:hypothetical protein